MENIKLKEFDITLDVKKSTQVPYFEVVVGDYDSNILNISLSDNGTAYSLEGLDVEIAFAKQDRTTVVQDKSNGVVIEDNIIKCTLASNTIAVSGTVYAEVRVLQDTKVLTSSRFRFYVRNPILNDKTVQSSNEFPMLVQALEDAKGAAESLPEINSAIDNIRNAESELNQSIGQASALDDTLNGTIQSAEQVKDALDGSIETAGTAKTQLDDSISSASTSKSELDNSIAQAGTAKNELDGSIAQAGTVKGELDSSIATAGQTKTALDESIATGELAEFKDNFTSHLNDYATYKDTNNLKIATVEKEVKDYQQAMSSVNVNQEPTQQATGYDMVSLPKNAANGQLSVSILGNTWTNKAGVGDTSPQTVENLDNTKSYLLINSLGKNVTIDTVDTPTPVKLTGAVSFDFVWAEGNIALYELSTTESALSAAELGQKYHYVSGTESTFSSGGKIKVVGKNLFDKSNVKLSKDATTAIEEGRECWVVSGFAKDFANTVIGNIKYKPNTPYTVSLKGKSKDTSSYYRVSVGYTDGTLETLVQGTSSSFALITGTTRQDKTVEYILLGSHTSSLFAYIDKDSVLIEQGIVATTYEPYTESTLYIPAGEPLRSLPSGTKDEFSVTEGLLTRRNKEYVLQASDIVSVYTAYVNIDIIFTKAFSDAASWQFGKDSKVIVDGYQQSSFADDSSKIGCYYTNPNMTLGFYVAKGTTLTQAKTLLTGTTLIYQLAEPIVTPINVSGTLLSYPNGTIYAEPIIADAGIYGANMAILDPAIPIKKLDKLSKVDYATGVETALDTSKAVIAADGKTFTHPSLVSSDIVFFAYEYAYDGTAPEIEATYYDSRYVIKDASNNKYYKWKVTSTNGTAALALTEV